MKRAHVHLACLLAGCLATAAAQGQTALQFNGTNQYVTMGTASGLGTATFTLECWFKRASASGNAGLGTVTGGNGFNGSIIPLVSKGRGEADATNVDCNYILGIQTTSNLLVADFEEAGTGPNPGLNHPICGSTAIADTNWHHAAATYSTAAGWSLYLDGVAQTVATACTNCQTTAPNNCLVSPGVAPRSDSIQHFGIASALTSTGVADGFFNGSIDEVRVWNVVRTLAEIQGAMNQQLTSGTGLIGRWGFNDGSGSSATNSIAGSPAGTLTNTPTWVTGAPALNNQPPNQPTLVTPANGASGVSTSPTLTVNVTDPESNPMTVTFFGRANTIPPPGPDFSIIALPDTQFYACGVPCSSDNGLLNAQLQWIVDNKASRNIAFVTQLGDCVEHGNDGNANGVNAEWDVANAAYQLIENPATTLLTYGIPFGIAVGNHDQTPINSPRNGSDEGATTTRYNNTFGVSRFLGRSYYGGRYDFGAPASYPNNNDNHYELFSASGLDFIIIHLEYDDTANTTRTAVLNWANGLLQTHSNRRAIITSHYILNPDGTFGNQGQAIYDALKGNANLFLMLCGHLDQANRRSDTFGGNTVNTLLSDYQSRPTGGRGWMRRLLFSPANNTIHVETFSPWANYPTTPKQEQLINSHADNAGTALNDFTLTYSMSNSAPAFAQIGSTQTGVASGSNTSVSWPGLTANLIYEWKVTVSDGTSTTNGPTWNFQTQCTGNAACDDGNPCTTDVCDNGACTHTNNTNSCNDGNNCTTGDVCSGGVCAGTPTNCLPGTSCNPANGLCESQPVTVTFQQGTAGYSGEVDTYIDAGAATANNGAAAALVVDLAPSVKQALLRFGNLFASEGGPIPAGATIMSATLTVNVGAGAGTVQQVGFHRMKAAWSASDNWNTFGTTPWNSTAGIQLDNVEANTSPDASTTIPDGVNVITVTSSVQAWYASPSSNFGWVLNETVDDSVTFDSAEGATVANRPKLTVTYLPPPPCQVNGDCNDGNACTTDTCNSGTCVYTPITCNDNSACTTDTCNPATGCVYTAISCDDGDGCTTDGCVAATGCTHTPVDCNDNDPCTADSCQPANTAAVSMNGSSQYVSIGTGAAVANFGTGSFTIEGWFKATATPTANVSLFRMGRSGNFPQAVVQILANTNTIAASVETNTSPSQADTATGITFTLNTWTHFAAVADRTAGAQRLRLYVNGSLVSDVDASVWSTNAISSTDPTIFGAARAADGTLNAFYSGALDEIRLWNTIRTQTQIQTNMNSQLSSASGLIAHWAFNEGTGTSAADSVGGNSGTLTGGATWITGAANLVNMGSGGCVHTPIANCCSSAAQCNDNNPCTTDTCNSGTCGHTPVSCPSGQTCNATNGQCELIPLEPPLPIVAGNTWKYFKGTVAPPSTWRAVGFDDSTWLSGPSGFGYADNDDATVLSDMINTYSAVFIRRKFNITNPATVTQLTLSVDYDDGYVAYINGVEVARSASMGGTVGTPPAFNALATGSHEASGGDSSPQPVEVTHPSPSVLVAGANVIAIQCHNNTIGSSDFSLIPALSATAVECVVAADCNDNNACTTDACNSGTCTHTAISCDDGNGCTTDSCNPATGCAHTPLSCDDGDSCTVDSCSGGSCQHVVNCDDGNPCTLDSCAPGNTAALVFDGTNDYVTMGAAAALNASPAFTLECWFKRTGTGVPTNTGTNGIASLVPLISKGGPQDETAANNMNYVLGIDTSTNTLAVDFEEATGANTGLNHPATSPVGAANANVIANNVWYHAAATYDGTNWRIYLNGNLIHTLLVSAVPEPNSGQHFALGTMLKTDGTAAANPSAAYFAGVLDEVRVWNVARAAGEVSSNMNGQITSATGLIGRWGLNDASGSTATASVGPNGTLTNGPTWATTSLPNVGGGCTHVVQDSDGDGVCNANDGCPNDPNKIAPGQCGCGIADTDSDGDGTANCNDGCPNDANKLAPGICGCGVADTDSDGDGTPNCHDGCPNDPNKTAPGICGCGVADTDSDGDGTANCIDGCPNDPNKIAPGQCGCGTADTDTDGDGTPNCHDGCPTDANKIAPGVCGCGVSDVDADGDGTPNCIDGCPTDPNKINPGICGCGTPDTDSDHDGIPDCNDHCPGTTDVDTDGDGVYDCTDGCPNDPNKSSPGQCGCGLPDTDSDNDGTANCHDNCPNDPSKINPGQCGCGNPETDTDGDGTANCNDGCPNDPLKTVAGQCGCGHPDTDSDNDGTANCNDGCPNDPDKIAPGLCGCGFSDADTDGDGTPNCHDGCPADPLKTAPGQCGCGIADTDTDNDGTANCNDSCPTDPNKIAPGACGCGVADTDSDNDGVPDCHDVCPGAPDIDTDGDGTLDCHDGCPADPLKTVPGQCGCGNLDTDTDGDGTADCHDGCPLDSTKTAPGVCGCGMSDADSDNDGTPNCIDGCPTDPNKINPGVCGCGTPDTDSDHDGIPDCNDHCPGTADIDSDGDGVLDCTDGCPNDPAKTTPGQCGCGTPDTDSDGDGTANCHDACPNDPNKVVAGQCGCGNPETDSDHDGTADCIDSCPNDPAKTTPGQCGCGNPETDSDGDGTANCIDGCPNDPAKISPGACGCGVADTDTDTDGTPDCHDLCPADPLKTAPGQCGCGNAETDTDSDGTADCIDGCPTDPNKIAPGLCGCNVAETDNDNDGTPNCIDGCPNDPNKIAPGACGCGVSDADSDHDGTPNCHDGCPSDPNKTSPGICGCGVADTDSDNDGIPDCNDHCPGSADVDSDGDGVLDCSDGCPNDPNKSDPGQCGCGVADIDTDKDGTANCNDGCPTDPDKTAAGQCGCGIADTDDDHDGTANCNDGCPNDPNKIAAGVCGCGVADTDSDADGVADCHDICSDTPSGQTPNAQGCSCSQVNCDDGNACTADTCTNGVCSNTPLTCDDGDACTTDSCDTQTGCHHVAVNCDDGNPCTVDSCNSQTGCHHQNASDGTSCSNGQFCDGAETCMSGACQPGTPPCDSAHCNEASDTCAQCISDAECADDGNPCTDEVCSAGQCTHPPKTNGTSCSDGLYCNGAETCQGGVCADGLDPCVDLAHCNEATDSCNQCVSAAECDDNNPCTADTCSAGACVHTPLNCINVTLHVDGLGHAVTRSVTFVLTPCGGTPETRVLPVSFAPSGQGYGIGSVTLSNVNANTAWLSAREGHTLRRRLPVSFPPTLSASVDFTGSNKLLAGDLQTPASSQDNLVDVIDFAILAARWNTVVGDCVGGLPAECSRGADVNGDGQQGTIDFTALQINFFATGDSDDACPPGVQAKRPIGVDGPLQSARMMRVRVSEIANRVPNAALADQNADGVIDSADIRLFAMRNRLKLLPAFDRLLQQTAPLAAER